jgi:hypothetical protein
MQPALTLAITLAAVNVLLDGAPAPQLLVYERVLLLETTSETSANVSFGDLDGDGHLDVVLAKGRHWPLVDRVLLGDGRGGIRSAHDLGAASDRSYSGRLADMNGDGSLDVVISNDTPDAKLVYLNDGKGRSNRAPPTVARSGRRATRASRISTRTDCPTSSSPIEAARRRTTSA